MKRISKLTLIILTFFGILIYSCDTDDSISDLNPKSEFKNESLEKISFSSIPIIHCDLNGPIEVVQNSSMTYYYTTDLSNPTIVWSIENIPSSVGDISIVSGQGTNAAVIHFGSNFKSATIKAEGKDIAGNGCYKVLNISLSGDGNTGGGENCSCPSPKIDVLLCVSGGHPYWRFQLNNVQSNDNIRWYASHATILAGQKTDYVVVNPSSSATAGFTLYCEVTRTCSNGTTKSRTAYYSNYYGGTCANGSGNTGFTSSYCGTPMLD